MEVNLLVVWRNLEIQTSPFFCTTKWWQYSSTDSCGVLLFFDIQIESCWRVVLIVVALYARLLFNAILKILLRYWRLLVSWMIRYWFSSRWKFLDSDWDWRPLWRLFLSCSPTWAMTWCVWFFTSKFPLIIGVRLTSWSWPIRKCRMCFIWWPSPGSVAPGALCLYSLVLPVPLSRIHAKHLPDLQFLEGLLHILWYLSCSNLGATAGRLIVSRHQSALSCKSDHRLLIRIPARTFKLIQGRRASYRWQQGLLTTPEMLPAWIDLWELQASLIFVFLGFS